jgi:hypothetical protein
MAVRQVGFRPSIAIGYALFFVYSIILTDLLRREIRRRGWLSGDEKRPFLKLLGASVAIAGVQCFLVLSVSAALEQKTGELFRPDALVGLFLSVTCATCGWSVLYVAFTAPRRTREKAVHYQLALREAELRALEAQVNPHFLFNCLNSIRGLVAENPPLAQDMITRLANILRYNLRHDPNHTVPLATEVEIASDYLALEAMRFDERLRVNFAVERSASQIAVPPMLLQTLVENAVKHGIAPLPEGGEVLVRAAVEGEALLLEVENPGHVAQPKPGGTQLGLANVRERLRLLYGARASVELGNRNGHVAASVRIPRTP